MLRKLGSIGAALIALMAPLAILVGCTDQAAAHGDPGCRSADRQFHAAPGGARQKLFRRREFVQRPGRRSPRAGVAIEAVFGGSAEIGHPAQSSRPWWPGATVSI